jgi:vacuolar-type H+-ATPase subunit E/Vma4
MSARTRVTRDAELVAILAPVRDALLADAEAEAARIVDEARRAADDAVATATKEADATVDAAQRRSELAGRVHADLVLAQARSDAHAAVLHVQEDLRRALQERVHAAVGELRGDPRYSSLLDGLEAMARTQLGGSAVIERDPDPHGGIVAVAGDRRVDYTLQALADRALRAIDDEVARLWR